MKKILTIAGSDASGGAGIQTDLRTFAKHNLYGLSAITAIVTMDPKTWQHAISLIESASIMRQIETAMSGVGVDAIKLGMLPSPEIMLIVSAYLKRYHGHIPIVVDPVMVCKGDQPLFPDHALVMSEALVPYATICTPNLFEAAQLACMSPLTSVDEVKQAAKKIIALGCQSVVIKRAGNLATEYSSDDLYYDGVTFTLAKGSYIDTSHTHGLGCTFAAHIAANLCKGADSQTACMDAKLAIQKGLAHHFKLSDYAGTLDFTYSFM